MTCMVLFFCLSFPEAQARDARTPVGDGSVMYVLVQRVMRTLHRPRRRRGTARQPSLDMRRLRLTGGRIRKKLSSRCSSTCATTCH